MGVIHTELLILCYSDFSIEPLSGLERKIRAGYSSNNAHSSHNGYSSYNGFRSFAYWDDKIYRLLIDQLNIG